MLCSVNNLECRRFLYSLCLFPYLNFPDNLSSSLFSFLLSSAFASSLLSFFIISILLLRLSFSVLICSHLSCPLLFPLLFAHLRLAVISTLPDPPIISHSSTHLILPSMHWLLSSVLLFPHFAYCSKIQLID